MKMAREKFQRKLDSSADPEGGLGVWTPWKITSYMGFYKEYAIGPPPPGKSWTLCLRIKEEMHLQENTLFDLVWDKVT